MDHCEENEVIDVKNTIFVAVGKNEKGSRSTLDWAVRSFVGKTICLVHVHQTTYMGSFVNENSSSTKLKLQKAVMAFQELERQKMHRILDQYLIFLSLKGVQANIVWIEMDNIAKGIAEIINQRDIRWLVMGAAADKYYSQYLVELKSRKAIYVCKNAPVSCHIWFSCKGCLIYTRGCRKEETIIETMLPLLLLNSDVGTEQSEATSPISEINKQKSLNFSHAEENDLHRHKVAGTLKSSMALPYELSTIMPVLCDEQTNYLAYRTLPNHAANFALPDSAKVKTEVLEPSEIYDKLPKAMMDAKNCEREAFEESVKRWKAEEDAIEAIQKAKTSESLCAKETIHRKEMEEELRTKKQETDTVKSQCEEKTKVLHIIDKQKPVLENHITESNCTMKELEEKIISAVGLLISLKERRDKMQMERDDAFEEVEKIRKMVKGEPTNSSKGQFFTFSEIIEATHNFDPSYKVGEGRNGSVYQGVLRHLHVAIKMLPSYGSQSDLLFQRKVEVLSRVRHPNLVTLIGTCPESRTLIYEYLKNQSIEHHLSNKNKTPALSWQTRTQIAIGICSALIFLHSNKLPIVHGFLKPTKILLDTNFVCKISDLGISDLNQQNKNLTDSISVYTDPQFIETGIFTPKSDVYSFGIILLRILTGRPAFGVVKDVKCALENGNFDMVLDISAGNWPLEQAKQLACLALKCCEKNRFDRPDLVSEVWSVLEPMKSTCVESTSYMHAQEQRRIPSHFVCPIFQEVMKDPHIAADGFTYEAEAIEGWLNSDHNTSPMTNLKLSHCNLIPNYALHYAIQEWQQKS